MLLLAPQAEPANYPPGAVWELEEGRGNATVEDICNFIVEYFNGDAIVCSHSGFVSGIHTFTWIVRSAGGLAHRHR
jgi:hypothetical protein